MQYFVLPTYMQKQTNDPRGNTAYYLCSTIAFITSVSIRVRARALARSSTAAVKILSFHIQIRLFLFLLVVKTKHIKNRLDVPRFFLLILKRPVSKFSLTSQTHKHISFTKENLSVSFTYEISTTT